MSRAVPPHPHRTTPLIGLEHPAGRDRPVGLEPLVDNLEAELVEAGERGQVRASKRR